MDSYGEFKEDIKNAVEEFRKIDKKEVIRVVSHLDADGLSAASIMVKCLNNESRKYSLSIVQQIKKEILDSLAKEPYKCFVFTDIGSGTITEIEKKFSGKKVFILDHHRPEKTEIKSGNIFFVNPHKFGIDASKEVSGAGVVYLFASCLDKKMEEFAHIAIIGAIGDVQENNGFERINNEILKTAVEKGKIKVIRGLRLFGAQTKPLYKVLEYCTDPFIPGVTGSESGAIQFLHQIGINPRHGSEWKKVTHLSKEEMTNLVTGVILKRLGEKNPDDVLGNVYLLRGEKEESPTKDAKEFATLLNACGRLDKASLGIGACLGDEKIKRKAIYLMSEYKREIINSLNWYNENKAGSFVTKGNGYVIINAQDKIRSTLIGTLASILSKSNNAPEKFIMSMAQLMDGTTKVSLRMCGSGNGRNTNGIDLKQIIEEIIKDTPKCEAGGHANAAGALIPTEIEDKFIEKAKVVLEKRAMEEIV
ncbi:DHH family phosphoesterase [Candidatus Woesearchaeota archaeon]|nr:DHH family phosphoesterase [Candidatus Woesearchaeota archaeon]